VIILISQQKQKDISYYKYQKYSCSAAEKRLRRNDGDGEKDIPVRKGSRWKSCSIGTSNMRSAGGRSGVSASAAKMAWQNARRGAVAYGTRRRDARASAAASIICAGALSAALHASSAKMKRKWLSENPRNFLCEKSSRALCKCAYLRQHHHHSHQIIEIANSAGGRATWRKNQRAALSRTYAHLLSLAPPRVTTNACMVCKCASIAGNMAKIISGEKSWRRQL